MSTPRSSDAPPADALAAPGPPVTLRKSPPEVVKAIKGKYANIPGSSAEFLAEKYRDVSRES